MMKFKVFYLILIFSIIGCSANLFDEIADKDTNEALFFQAKQQINSRDFGGAITTFDSIISQDSAFLADRGRIPIHASAYSGRCGLEFLSLLNNLQSAGAATIFTTLMSLFPGALAANVQDCIDSETIMDGIGDQNTRTGDENLFMAFNAFAKIGTILSSLADTDDDGTADAAFNQCDVDDFPDTMVRELGASVAVSILSLQAIGTSYVDDQINEVDSFCDVDPSLATFCNSTDPSSFGAAEVLALRYAIGSNDVGINSCGNNDFGNCVLANPAPLACPCSASGAGGLPVCP